MHVEGFRVSILPKDICILEKLWQKPPTYRLVKMNMKQKARETFCVAHLLHIGIKWKVKKIIEMI